MMNASAVTVWRCTYCEKEWDPSDGVNLAELCPFRHAHSNGWYRTKHQLDTITISIPDDPGGLWESKS